LDAAATLLRAKGRDMRSKLLGLGLGLTLSTLGVVAIPTMAFADTTCYTGCSSPTQGSNPPAPPQSSQTVANPVVPLQSVNSGGLALTGGDIEGMVAAGAGALVVGGLLVRRSRRQLRATA
jgi:hypothetical protein